MHNGERVTLKSNTSQNITHMHNSKSQLLLSTATLPAPQLSINNQDPTEKNNLLLSCAIQGLTGSLTYEFLLGGQRLILSNSNTYFIPLATIGTHEGSYTCVVSGNGQTSQPSAPITVARESFVYTCRSLYQLAYKKQKKILNPQIINMKNFQNNLIK